MTGRKEEMDMNGTEPQNLYELVTRNMEQRFAGRAAFRWYDEAADAVCCRTYRECAQDIRRAVRYFQSTVPEVRGKRICLWSNNSYAYAVNCYGIMLAGGVVVPLNQRKSWDELSYELQLVEPAAILTDGEDYGCNAEVQAAYGSILRPMDGFAACEPGELADDRDPEALMVLMFTSGTTGRSKGVMLCERNFFAVMHHHVSVGRHICEAKQDPDLIVDHLTVLPMFHLGAFGCLFSGPWMGWAQNLGSLRSFYKDLQRMPSQDMAAVPVLVESIHHDLMSGRREKLGQLWALNCMSAMFNPKTLLDLTRNGILISQFYGCTETTGGGLINFAADPEHIGAVGKPDGHCEFKLEDGEICLRGGDVMLGYYKDPEGTAEVIDTEGWFHTGDLARQDAEGYVFLTGRKKNLIILDSGENVSPEELEKLLEKCPAVQECLVKESGKKICAMVYCEEKEQSAVRAFITEVNRTLPLYKRMSAVEFSSGPLPRNAMGKLLR